MKEEGMEKGIDFSIAKVTFKPVSLPGCRMRVTGKFREHLWSGRDPGT
jgi:hypothetical protein